MIRETPDDARSSLAVFPLPFVDPKLIPASAGYS